MTNIKSAMHCLLRLGTSQDRRQRQHCCMAFVNQYVDVSTEPFYELNIAFSSDMDRTKSTFWFIIYVVHLTAVLVLMLLEKL